MTLENDLNNLNRDKFVSMFGVIFEKTQWIAEKLFDHKPFKNKEDLINKMFQIYESTQKNEVLVILKSHPKLAVEKNLTKHSSEEQSHANLKNCTDEEYNEFKRLNNEYEEKFGFPFIIAVKGKNKIEILNNFRQRINNDIELEFSEAKSQVRKIAQFRLDELFIK